MKIKKLLPFLACIIIIHFAQADVLELKNGDSLNGTFVGGTQNAIRFQVGENVEVIPISDALALTFSGSGSSSSSSGGYSSPRYDTPRSANTTTTPRSSTGSRSVTLPAGTSLLVMLVEPIDTKTDKAGKRFRTRLAADLYAGDTFVAREGSLVYGTLQQSKQAGRIAGTSSVDIALTEIEINERLFPIFTTDHIERGKDATKGTLHAVGAGAIIGALVDKNNRGGGAMKGAAIGTGVALITPGKPVQIPANTLLEFRLAQPLTITAPM